MKLKDLKILKDTLMELGDFVESNSDADESGIANKMADLYNESIEIIEDATYKIYLRNALAVAKRKRDKQWKIKD